MQASLLIVALSVELLLPFSLKSYADNGYANRSLVAMFVVGGICLIAWLVWEIRFAPFPTAPKRLLSEVFPNVAANRSRS